MIRYMIMMVLLLCLISVQLIRAQLTGDTQEKIIEVSATYVGDIAANFSGGLKRGTQYLGLANFRIELNSGAARLWKGGQLFINGSNAHGGDPSVDLIGDYHIVSNIETSDITYLHELWYRQSIGSFHITIGLQDLNSEFVSTTYGSTFINSSFGTPSTIANNIPSPIFPLTAIGVSLGWNISRNIVKLAIFDGVPTSFSDNPHNLRWKLDDDEGIFAIAEYSHPFSLSGHEGQYKAGAYYHSQYSTADDDIHIPEKYNYNYGFYFIADQVLWKTAAEKNIGLFGQIAISPRRLNNHNLYLGTGLTFKGLLPGRPEDVFCIAYNRTWMKGPVDDESIIEIGYKAQVCEKLFIQPDIQYIMNPNGSELMLDNAIVGLIRLGLAL